MSIGKGKMFWNQRFRRPGGAMRCAFLTPQNAIIALLTALCLFLALHQMGAFSFRGDAPSESYRENAKRRVKAVLAATSWNVATAEKDAPLVNDFLDGLDFAVKRVNSAGGILDKAVRLSRREGGTTFRDTKFLVRDLCNQADTALFIGPWNTFETRSVRGLTQFQALPTLAITLNADLPPLHPDTFVSLLPPLSLLTTPVHQALVRAGCGNLLIVTPGKTHYGAVFASALEQELWDGGKVEAVFRVNYDPPAALGDLFEQLKLFRDNLNLDAVIFAGDETDLHGLGEAMRALNMAMPVYGSDLMDVPGLEERLPGDFPSRLIYPRTVARLLDAETMTAWSAQYGQAPGMWAQYGAAAILLFRDALLENGAYDPAELTAAMRRLWEAQSTRRPPPLSVTMREAGRKSGN
jgi:ABC-type branched-subunit amino acid transport system substrate-binding protein